MNICLYLQVRVSLKSCFNTNIKKKSVKTVYSFAFWCFCCIWDGKYFLKNFSIFFGKGKPTPGFRSQPFHHPYKHKSCKLHHLQHIQYPPVSNNPFSRPTSSSTWKVPHLFFSIRVLAFFFFFALSAGKQGSASVCYNCTHGCLYAPDRCLLNCVVQ